MFHTYIIISIILIIIGTISSVYFAYYLKTSGLEENQITALSESLLSVFIGFFYLYCAILMAQNATNIHETPESYDKINQTEIIGELTTEIEKNQHVTTTDKNKNYSMNYQNVLVRNNTLEHRNRNLEPQENIMSYENCFREILMENSMFLYSFLTCVLSLISNIIQRNKNGNYLTMKEDIPETGHHNTVTLRNSESESNTEKPTKNCKKLKMIAKLVTIWFIPILGVILLYFMINTNMVQLSTDFNMLKIIENPLNVSVTNASKEINEVVENVYKIVKNIQPEMISPPPAKFTFNTFLENVRKPKETLENCPIPDIWLRIYVFIVFLFYFTTILYTKIKETKIKQLNTRAAKEMNVSIGSFALLWAPSILELLGKIYLLGTVQSDFFTDISLSMGNLNRLSIIGINYLASKNNLKQNNIVGPVV